VNREEFAAQIEAAMVEHADLDNAYGRPLKQQAAKISDELWPILAEVWREGRAAGLNNWLAPNPYEPWPIDPLDRLCECNHRMGDHNQGRCVATDQCPCRVYVEAKVSESVDSPV